VIAKISRYHPTEEELLCVAAFFLHHAGLSEGLLVGACVAMTEKKRRRKAGA
jgi:hypothetical protein